MAAVLKTQLPADAVRPLQEEPSQGLLTHSFLGGLVLCGSENCSSQLSLEPGPLASPRILQATE